MQDNIKDIAVSVLNDKLSSTFNDRLKRLFGSMLMIFENNDFEYKLSNKIYNEIDKELRMKLLEVPSIIDKACNERMPHYIADYLYDLAVLTNNFYQNNNISKLNNQEIKNDWISLLKYTYMVIEKLLSLLIIEIPSEM